MAQKRMFNISITDTDKFLDMPATSQNLYFHLNMHADDDGFVDSPKRIMRNLGAHQNDMDILLSKQFIFVFESGILVIRDWKIHNIIRKDTYKPTLYQYEKNMLEEEKSGSYRLRDEPVTDPYRLRDEPVAQIRLDKNRLDKDRLDIYSPVSNETKDDIPYKEIVDYLNDKAKTNYRASGKDTKSHIKARWNEGFNLDNFKTVINKQVARWTNTDYQQYLRPKTLFGTKFESYLNSPDPKPKHYDANDALFEEYGIK